MRGVQVNSGFFYSNAEQREQLVAAERAVTDDRVRRVIQLKQEVSVNHGLACLMITQSLPNQGQDGARNDGGYAWSAALVRAGK